MVGGLLLAACSASGPSPAGARTIEVDGQAVSASSLGDAVRGLCLALERLAADPTAARAAFYDLPHDRLVAATKGALSVLTIRSVTC